MLLFLPPMADQDKIILPEKYYLDNFKYVLQFVLDKYKPLLSDTELLFIHDFMALSEDSQCLYVRISNRKGQFFRKEKLNYPEIKDIGIAHLDLLDRRFIVKKTALEIDECFQLINSYNKPEIVQRIKPLDLSIDKRLKKDELILTLLEIVDGNQLYDTFYTDDIIAQGGQVELDMIKLFFFGHNHGDMSDFVVRDIGHVKFLTVDETQLGSSFDSREEAEAIMHLSQLHKEYYLLEEALTPLAIYEWFAQIEIKYFLALDKARPQTEKLIHKVGYHLEKHKHYDEALTLYHLTTASPMRERRIRIYNKQKAFDLSLNTAQEILNHPNDNKEYYIAQDVINKLDKKLKTTTIRQKEGLMILVDYSYVQQVEQGVLAYFESQGYSGYHSENTICRNIFGLFFWEEIFDPQYNSLHQPLQRSPSDIYGKDFYTKRKEAIEAKLSSTKSKAQLRAILNRSIQTHDGVANPFVYWNEDMIAGMWQFLAFAQLKQIKALLATIAIDPKNRSTGFPDLFVWKDKDYAFYEVKSPNDHLSEKQLFWLEHFDAWGIKAEIALVEWTGKE
ncbi:VRR-NUC domain-containing protein [Reichenbachiella carrageenanivorans]|uniref:phosphodiesterase I n=1 Tax=Reichenbachiella carrageenanivorans TaxID=2979869 RepID=A0ABY6D510_9BACT|nr:VRR-NUC domain-containing protein [Reichenbachiella carrageenanivorans]UXX81188.1 VRR-NUC domain-containing protein [Reichenbachiella carrageenanivorans]